MMKLKVGKSYQIEVFGKSTYFGVVRDTGSVLFFDCLEFGHFKVSEVRVIREIASESESDKALKSPWDSQIGGSHYTDKAIQPLQRTLLNKGYEAFSGACYTKIDKYTTRIKDNEVEQLKKAKHVLELWIYEAEQQANK